MMRPKKIEPLWEKSCRGLRQLGYKLALAAAMLGIFTLASNSAYAQAKKVTGKVISATDKQPLPGVSVQVKGTNSGAFTGADGQFTLNVSDGQELVFSFIGYESQSVKYNGQDLNVVLVENSQAISELVVVGYGVQKKKLNTGATIQVKGNDLASQSTTNALQALQGKTPGVQISSTSGQPGESVKVTIRGLGTIGKSGPLYIVDGVQTDNILFLNNNDIESLDVLKDAASAAIYGSQAANGVVIITTKQGSEGRATVTFDGYTGWQSASHKVSMLNAEQYSVIMNEAAINSGKAPLNFGSYANQSTNWLDEMLVENVPTQNYSLGVNGGSKTSIYSLSLSYTKQGGIVGGENYSDYERYGFRTNTEHKLYKDIVKVGQHFTFAYIKKNGIGVGNQYNNSLRGAFNTSPFLPMYDDSGNFLNNTADKNVMYNGAEWTPWAPGENNPYATMTYNNQNDNNEQKLIGDVYAEVNPIKGLKFKTIFSIDYDNYESRSFRPVYQLSMYDERIHSDASQSITKGLTWMWDNVLSYDFNVNDHAFSTMVGSSARRYSGTFLSARNSDLVIADLDHAYVDNATNKDVTLLSLSGKPQDENMLASFFGRVNYNYKERYLLNATFRADGSSRFAKKNRWGYFPSVSAGWVLTNESFMAPTQDWLDFFKLRASWGQVGNQDIDPWQYLATIQTSLTNYIFGNNLYGASFNTSGAYPNRLGNEDLKWETSEQLNIGFDARMLKGRLSANFDFYNKTTRDWLIVAPILATAGADAPFMNGGDVRNRGVELGLGWNDKIGDFTFSISGNIAYNKNEVTKVPTNDGIVHGLTNMLYDNSEEFYRRAETGHPIGYFWGYKTDGLFQTEAEVNSYKNASGTIIQPNAKPGDVRYVDINGDGVIDDKDKTEIGNPNPDYTFGLNLTVTYKQFDLSVASYGVAGNQIVQSYRNHANQFANYTTEILGRWHGEGTSNSIPRATESNVNYQFSDLFVKKGDYFRISNITLGYDFSRLINKGFLSQLRLYGSVLNPFTFTKYNGMDPEIGYGVENGSLGVDLGYYPRPTTFLIGANIKF